MALFDHMADERVGRLQIEDVKLVDARRHQQERTLVDLGSQRLVLDELKNLVFKHHRAFASGHVFANLELAFIGHGHMALAHIVQHVLQPVRNAFAFGVYGFLLGFGVERQKIAG